jgi:hypothetical protein
MLADLEAARAPSASAAASAAEPIARAQVSPAPRSATSLASTGSSRTLVLASLAFFLLCVAVAAALFFTGSDGRSPESPAAKPAAQ